MGLLSAVCICFLLADGIKKKLYKKGYTYEAVRTAAIGQSGKL